MRFAFTDDQLAFRDGLRALLAKECGPEVVRAAWPDDDTGAGARADPVAPAAVWTRLGEMGVLGVAVPEDAGGLGLDELDWVLLAEETGYVALPHPFVETALVAAPLLAACGDPGSRVGRIVAGELELAAELTGSSSVPWAGRHRIMLLRRGDELFLVARRAGVDGVAPAVDGALAAATRPVDLVEADRVTDDPELADLAFDRGALGTAAQLVGLSQRMLDMAVGYAGQRHQFGVPVGSFQAVKHQLADALLHLSFARPAVHRAAYSVAHDRPTRGRDVSMAKAMASDTARLVGAKALQCHGAIGYTVEYDLHLYLKRAWALASTWGTAAWHRDRVGRAIGVDRPSTRRGQ